MAGKIMLPEAGRKALKEVISGTDARRNRVLPRPTIPMTQRTSLVSLDPLLDKITSVQIPDPNKERRERRQARHDEKNRRRKKK